MMGSSYKKYHGDRRPAPGTELLRTEGLSDKKGRITGINLSLRAGEIVGITGLVGAGKSELCKTLFGAYGRPDGTMKIKGVACSITTPARAVKAGMALIPEERRKEGVLVEEPVYVNLSLAILSEFADKFSFLKKNRELKHANKIIDLLGIRTPDAARKVKYLSGGNQQKVTIGKWLDRAADIYIFDEPTKGIDVGAKMEIYQLIIDLANRGKGIIFTSNEQSEILQITDRVYVMYDGTIRKEFVTVETGEEQLMFYSTGATE